MTPAPPHTPDRWFRTSDQVLSAAATPASRWPPPHEAGRGVVRGWRLLFASWQPELVTTGRVRLRRLVCVCRGERTRVVVGPPRCASCTDTVVHDRNREPPAADS